MPTDRQYTGQRRETGLGLYDYQARYYNPVLGRFIQADTIVPEPGNPQALNRYAYGYNNPVKYYDPTGHIPEVIYNETMGYYTVKLDIQIYGSGASAELAEEWQEHLNNVWNNGDTQFDGEPVVFNITVTHKEPKFSGLGKFLNWLGLEGFVTPKSGDTKNLILVLGGGGYEPPDVRPNHEGQDYDWGIWYSEMGNGYALHESAHLMGIYENHFNESNNETDPNYPGYITADAYGYNNSKPCDEEVHEIILLAINRGQFSTVKTGLPAP